LNLNLMHMYMCGLCSHAVHCRMLSLHLCEAQYVTARAAARLAAT
jgi:hypothetical protein